MLSICILLLFSMGAWVEQGWSQSVLERGDDGKTASDDLAAVPAESLDGSVLAQRYCVTCHLVPSPSELTKKQWVHQIMPQMAVWLGVEKPNFGAMKDGELLRAAGLFPDKATITDEAWFAIWDYYRREAPSDPLVVKERPDLDGTTPRFTPTKLNFAPGAPMTSLVRIEDQKLMVGDGYAGVFASVNPTGTIINKQRVGAGPVHMQRAKGGWYLALIGQMFPSDVPSGSIAFLPDDFSTPRTVLTKLRRPTHLSIADVNRDGRDDLLVSSFGNRLGNFSWYEFEEDESYTEHVLIDQPGAIRSEVHDFNSDGLPDVVVQMAQAREAIYLLINKGNGEFSTETVSEQSPLFGYADFQLVDFNQDGLMDILAVNGDNGDNPTPGKRYHGIRLYLNQGGARFKEAWFYPLEGAYKAMPADFDEDGDEDFVAISYYPDWKRGARLTALFVENIGNGRFRSYALPGAQNGRWLTMDVGDADGDGDIDVALGSFSRGPVTIPVPAAVEGRWRSAGAAVLFLRNTTR